jgi:hypothetical protein
VNVPDCTNFVASHSDVWNQGSAYLVAAGLLLWLGAGIVTVNNIGKKVRDWVRVHMRRGQRPVSIQIRQRRVCHHRARPPLLAFRSALWE